MAAKHWRDKEFEQLFVQDGERIRKEFLKVLRYGKCSYRGGIFARCATGWVLAKDWELEPDKELEMLRDPGARQGHEIWRQGLLVLRGCARESWEVLSKLCTLFKQRPAIYRQA